MRAKLDAKILRVVELTVDGEVESRVLRLLTIKKTLIAANSVEVERGDRGLGVKRESGQLERREILSDLNGATVVVKDETCHLLTVFRQNNFLEAVDVRVVDGYFSPQFLFGLHDAAGDLLGTPRGIETLVSLTLVNCGQSLGIEMAMVNRQMSSLSAGGISAIEHWAVACDVSGWINAKGVQTHSSAPRELV